MTELPAIRIDYIEFAVADAARSKAFYGRAFGWTFTDFGPVLDAVRRYVGRGA